MTARRGRVVDCGNSVQSGGYVGEWEKELGHSKVWYLRAPVTNWALSWTSRPFRIRAFRPLICSFQSLGLFSGRPPNTPPFFRPLFSQPDMHPHSPPPAFGSAIAAFRRTFLASASSRQTSRCGGCNEHLETVRSFNQG